MTPVGDEPSPPQLPQLTSAILGTVTEPRRTFSLRRDVLEGEVRIDTFRASGPGGQHVNKTNSAIRLTHTPSGVVVIAQDSPSQFRNKETAFERLIAKLKRLNHVPKKRLATKPTRASKERRIGEKKTRAVVKSGRSKKVHADE
jgi:protein subunit release factor A